MKGRRNRLPRASSPDGVKARMELRIKGFEKAPHDVAKGFRQPGSRNPRKIGR